MLIVNWLELLPESAERMAVRRVSGPESARELTVRWTTCACAGTARSSSASRLGRNRVAARERPVGRLCLVGPRFRSQDENDMMLLLSRTGLRCRCNTPGAQTMRRGLGRLDLASRVPGMSW